MESRGRRVACGPMERIMKNSPIVLIEGGTLAPESNEFEKLLQPFAVKRPDQDARIVLALPRSVFFLTWRLETSQDDVFPLPKEKLTWTELSLETEENALRLFL